MSINCCTEFIKPMSSRPSKVCTYVGFGPPDIPDAPIGTIYVDVANYDDHTSTAAKDNKNITNCRNCGAIIKGCVCEYCGTVY